MSEAKLRITNSGAEWTRIPVDFVSLDKERYDKIIDETIKETLKEIEKENKENTQSI